MPRIFISYRRSDTEAYAGRIYDSLVNTFGRDQIFKDVYDIRPGKDFRGELRKAVAQCEIVLVLIGPGWLTTTNSEGQRRLDAPDDWVRLEVEMGLQSSGVTVIPLMLGGAGMPSVEELPDTLRELAYRNGFVVRGDPNYHADMGVLIRHLADMGQPAPVGGLRRILSRVGGCRIQVIIIMMLTLVLAIVYSSALIFSGADQQSLTETATRIALAVTDTPTTLPPTETPTATDQPSVTATHTPTGTATPTVTATATPEPTQTVTQTAGAIGTATYTPAPSGDSIPLTIYRDEDSFTLYVPQSSEQVSLVGLEFRVGISGGEQIIRRLDTDFSGFLGIPFNNISSLGAVCFRLVRADRANPVPQVCQNSVLLLTQQLVNADVFWRDARAALDRTVLVYKDDMLIGACGPEPSCVVNWRGG